MKLKLFKKITWQVKSKNKGFALLFSVLLSSLLLTIGLSIFSIALKELAISTAARQSVHAFYAADSGRECVLYWDGKKGQIPGLSGVESLSGNIKCGNASLAIHGDNNFSPMITVIPKIFLTSDTDGPNFDLTITKKMYNLSDPASMYETTKISSVGHDSDSGDRVERQIEQTIGDR